MCESVARRALFLAFVVFAECSAIGAESSGPLEPSLKTIANAWSNRQSRIKTVRVAWQGQEIKVGLKEELLAFGTSQRGRSRAANTKPTGSATVDLSRAPLASESLLCFDGDSLAYSYVLTGAEQVNTPDAMLRVPTHFKGILTATECRLYADTRPDSHGPDLVTGNVTIIKPEKCDIPRYPDVRPLVLALRPSSVWLSRIDLDKYTISREPGRIGDTPCVILKSADQFSRKTISYWLDPARDFIIMRAVLFLSGNPAFQTDIEYSLDSVVGWVPSYWTVVQMNDETGALKSTTRSKITKLAVNVPMQPSDFNLEEPDGLLVNDATVKPSQSWRIGGDTASVRQPEVRRWHVLLVVNGLVVVALLATLFARKYFRSQHK